MTRAICRKEEVHVVRRVRRLGIAFETTDAGNVGQQAFVQLPDFVLDARLNKKKCDKKRFVSCSDTFSHPTFLNQKVTYSLNFIVDSH
jgi:hypothetical protein